MSGPEAEIEVSVESADTEPGRSLLAAMEDELDDLYRKRPGSLDSLPVSAADLAAPHGTFIVLRVAGEDIACGGVKRLDATTGEIKRMYVSPAHRNRGLARRLLAELEHRARELGYRRVRLDTGSEQPAARSIYERSGYRSIAPYNDNPYATFWFEKDLCS